MQQLNKGGHGKKSCQKNISDIVIRDDFSSFLHKAFTTINPQTSYQHNWHIDLIAEVLQQAYKGKLRRVIINIPPRYLKSMIINVAWSAYLLGVNPASRIISASYSKGLAAKHSLDSKLIINSPWYRNIFSKTQLTHEQNDKYKYITTERGYRIATSVGGTLTGEGGNFLLLDDPHNPAHIMSKTRRQNVHNWFEQVFASRLDDKKKGVIILIMQRLHQDDLSGYLLEKSDNLPSEQKWYHLNIPAYNQHQQEYNINGKKFVFPACSYLHQQREGLAELAQIKSELGSFAFNAQYLQNPLSKNNSVLDYDKITRYEPKELQILLDIANSEIYQSWDCAVKSKDYNDYSVCTSWLCANGKIYLLDLLRDKMEYPELKLAMIKQSQKFANRKVNNILIEDKASGSALIQDLRQNNFYNIVPINPKLDKVTRFSACSVMFENGTVMLPKYASWLTDLEHELLNFPNSPHDDQVDSISQFLNWLSNRRLRVPRIRRL